MKKNDFIALIRPHILPMFLRKIEYQEYYKMERIMGYRAFFKHITKVKTKNPDNELTFGQNELFIYRWRTGIDRKTGAFDLIPREYHDYELENGMILLDVLNSDVRLEFI